MDRAARGAGFPYGHNGRISLVTRSGFRTAQREDELRDFIALLLAEDVRSYVEIGCRYGDTFYEVMMALPEGSRGVALDYDGGPWGNEGSAPILEEAVGDIRGRVGIMVAGDSRKKSTANYVRLMGPYDAIFIDGDHRYESVKADWENYRDMARIIAFHDIDGEGHSYKAHGGRIPVEVPRFWSEIKGGYRHREIIGAERGMGIGVIWTE